MPSFSFLRRALPLAGLALVCLAAVTGAPAAPAVPSAAAAQAALPGFACYEARFSPLRSPTLRIADSFGRRTTTLAAAVSYCAPAAAPGVATVTGAPVHLACHSLADRTLSPVGLQLAGPFGRLRATLVGAQTLCTPASVTTGGGLSAPPAGIDDFACYATERQAASRRPLAVADRFGVFQDLLGRVVSVCSPASVDGSRLHGHAFLVCHELISEARARPAIVRSRFALLKASPGLRRQLCVPSSRL
jgi:hypothetical protein